MLSPTGFAKKVSRVKILASSLSDVGIGRQRHYQKKNSVILSRLLWNAQTRKKKEEQEEEEEEKKKKNRRPEGRSTAFSTASKVGRVR